MKKLRVPSGFDKIQTLRSELMSIITAVPTRNL